MDFQDNQTRKGICKCTKNEHEIQLVVLTGGPGAGKTAILETARKLLCEHVIFLPEAAGIIFGGGFWRIPTIQGRVAAQKVIYSVQNELENLVLVEKKWGLGLCDRGTLDGMAYWPETGISFWDCFQTTKEKEYSKYKAVIHLRTPSLEKGYNHQNPIRVEGAEEAALIDIKIEAIWKDHPRYFQVASKELFLEKVIESFRILKTIIPPCCQG